MLLIFFNLYSLCACTQLGGCVTIPYCNNVASSEGGKTKHNDIRE